ncbi:MAG: 30S ribosomal protein S17 [Bacteriovoracaceae bacterium]|nr:30S ribosomal protein S17 [Bacteriovoracaceae bacterium]
MTTKTEAKTKFKRKLSGTVVSDKAEKTIVVKVIRRYKHPKYLKYIHSTKKYHAHDEKSQAKEGDNVIIIESRPYSKLKKWELLEVK